MNNCIKIKDNFHISLFVSFKTSSIIIIIVNCNLWAEQNIYNIIYCSSY